MRVCGTFLASAVPNKIDFFWYGRDKPYCLQPIQSNNSAIDNFFVKLPLSAYV